MRITEKELIVYGPDVREIARHELYPSGITGEKHSLPEHAPGRDHHHKYGLLKERFEAALASDRWSSGGPAEERAATGAPRFRELHHRGPSCRPMVAIATNPAFQPGGSPSPRNRVRARSIAVVGVCRPTVSVFSVDRQELVRTHSRYC